MVDSSVKNTADVMKQLREERKDSIGQAREAMKEQNRIIKMLKEGLAEGARTIPDLAASVGMETSNVMIYISSLKKYGIVGEVAKDGDYFTYELLNK